MMKLFSSVILCSLMYIFSSVFVNIFYDNEDIIAVLFCIVLDGVSYIVWSRNSLLLVFVLMLYDLIIMGS